MNQMAHKLDFDELHVEQRNRYEQLLRFLLEQRMACRFEMVGADFVCIVGQGYPSPKYWMDKFDIS